MAVSVIRGDYVRCTTGEGKVGVVSDVRQQHSYVRWMTNWDEQFSVVKWYLEFVSHDDLEVLGLEAHGTHPGLEQLRRKTLA